MSDDLTELVESLRSIDYAGYTPIEAADTIERLTAGLRTVAAAADQMRAVFDGDGDQASAKVAELIAEIARRALAAPDEEKTDAD